MSSLLDLDLARSTTPWVALPVFTTRRFFHTRILVRADAGIARARRPQGQKRVGVPEYQQTAAIWGRGGAAENEFGVRPEELATWSSSWSASPDKSHGGATGFKPPAGRQLVNQIPPSTNIGEMLVSGEPRATLLYLTDRNLVDRSRIDLGADKAQCARLFPDPRRRGRSATTPRPASIRSTTRSWSAARSSSSTPGSR